MLKKKKALFLKISLAIALLSGLFALAKNSWAATIAASSCSEDDVQAKVSAAGDGDTVSIPAGNCTWTSALTVSAGVTLQGSGTLQTAITGNNTSSYYILVGSGPSSTYPFRVTNIYFKFNNNYSIRLDNWFRMDHNNFEAVSGGVKAFFIVSTHGLFDNNQFTNVGWQVDSTYDVPASNDAIWAAGPQWGTENAVFFEGNTITQNFQNLDMDCNYAGRVVYRYNTLQGMFGNHGGEVGNYRGCQRQDIYNNHITAPEPGTNIAIQFRGGTGMVYNNIIDNGSSGDFSNWIILENYCSTLSWFICIDPPGRCGPSPDAYNYPCPDQPGVGHGAWGSQTPPDPLYFWNNCHTTLGCGTGVGNIDPVVPDLDYLTTHIQANREYYARTDGTLHGYTPYTCPHPLAGLTGLCDPNTAGRLGYNVGASGDTTPPAAPSGLSVN